MNRVIILIPTYNESVSIVELLDQLKVYRLSAEVEFDVLVIDDNSPDGTAEKVDDLRFSSVKVLRPP